MSCYIVYRIAFETEGTLHKRQGAREGVVCQPHAILGVGTAAAAADDTASAASAASVTANATVQRLTSALLAAWRGRA